MTEEPLLIDCRWCDVTLTLTVTGVDEWNGVHVSHVDHARIAMHMATHDAEVSRITG